jgi:tetratricopeptide (TPR) repeat protein
VNSFTAWYYRTMARIALFFGQDDVAMSNWLRVLAINPKDARMMVTIANAHAGAGGAAAALEWLDRAVKIDPTEASAWYNMGYIYQEGEQHEQALAAFDRAIACNEKLDQAYYGKGISLVKLGRFDDAVVALKANTKLQPMSPYGWYQLAHTYKKMNDTERVIKVIKKLSAFEPNIALLLQKETGIDAGVKSPFA